MPNELFIPQKFITDNETFMLRYHSLTEPTALSIANVLKKWVDMFTPIATIFCFERSWIAGNFEIIVCGERGFEGVTIGAFGNSHKNAFDRAVIYLRILSDPPVIKTIIQNLTGYNTSRVIGLPVKNIEDALAQNMPFTFQWEIRKEFPAIPYHFKNGDLYTTIEAMDRVYAFSVRYPQVICSLLDNQPQSF